MSRLPYPALCAILGLLLGGLPALVHGPVPEKWTVYGIHGATLVAGYHVARLSVGLWVGLTCRPESWFLRGPLCGAVAMLPLGLVAWANPLCGATCMAWNTATGAALGFAVGALAWSITGRHHAGA